MGISMGIPPAVMQKKETPKAKAGRPRVAVKKVQLNASVTGMLLAAVRNEANKRDMNLSTYVALALTNQLRSEQ